MAEANRFFHYPYVAIEEALSNAVYHKGYDIWEPNYVTRPYRGHEIRNLMRGKAPEIISVDQAY